MTKVDASRLHWLLDLVRKRLVLGGVTGLHQLPVLNHVSQVVCSQDSVDVFRQVAAVSVLRSKFSIATRTFARNQSLFLGRGPLGLQNSARTDHIKGNVRIPRLGIA